MPYAPLPENTGRLGDRRHRFRAARHPERKRRLHALVLPASGEAPTRRAVGERLGVDRQTVARRLGRYRDGGLGHLLTPGKRGPAPGQRLLPAPVPEALERRLDSPDGFAGYHEVRRSLHDEFAPDEFALDLPYKSVYTLVRYRLEAKLKVPRPAHPKKA